MYKHWKRGDIASDKEFLLSESCLSESREEIDFLSSSCLSISYQLPRRHNYTVEEGDSFLPLCLLLVMSSSRRPWCHIHIWCVSPFFFLPSWLNYFSWTRSWHQGNGGDTHNVSRVDNNGDYDMESKTVLFQGKGNPCCVYDAIDRMRRKGRRGHDHPFRLLSCDSTSLVMILAFDPLYSMSCIFRRESISGEDLILSDTIQSQDIRPFHK
jgi:hypothetical protein